MSVCTFNHTPQPPPLPNTGGYCLQRGALLAASQLRSVTGLVLLQLTGCAGPLRQTKRSLHKQLLTVSCPPGLDRKKTFRRDLISLFLRLELERESLVDIDARTTSFNKSPGAAESTLVSSEINHTATYKITS